MNPNQELWEKGDFTRIAAAMGQSGEELIKRIGVASGDSVLDLGCGDGTTAIPSAKQGASVLGVDIARNLVEAGNFRASSLGLSNLKFQHGDATNLEDIGDSSFDWVISIFGAMFAPRPFDVAKEMVRVTRPGGKIVMGNWIPGDPTLVAQILRISSSFTPPPPEGFVSPMLWGVKENVIERFGSAGVPEENIRMEHDTFTFRIDESPGEYLARFRDFYCPTMNAYAAAQNNGRAEELHQELLSLFESKNESGVPDSVVIPATFLRVTVSV